MGSLAVFCDNCQDLFTGEIKPGQDRWNSPNFHLKSDHHTYPTTPPTNGCLLCLKIYQHLDGDIFHGTKEKLLNMGLPTCVIDRQLSLKSYDGVLYYGNLQGYSRAKGSGMVYKFDISRRSLDSTACKFYTFHDPPLQRAHSILDAPSHAC